MILTRRNLAILNFCALFIALGGCDKVNEQPNEAEKDQPKWHVSESKSPIDDSPGVTLYLPANDTVRGTLSEKRPTLIIRCKEGKTDTYIYWGSFFKGETASVTTRLDEQEAKTETWYVSTGSDGLFPPVSGSEYAQSLENAEQFVARTKALGTPDMTAVFNLAGIKQNLARVKAACNWPETTP